MKTTAKQKRELKLFNELQNKHGYTLLETVRGMEKTLLMFDFKTKKASVSHVMRLSVPSDSALGEAIVSSRRRAKDEKTTKKSRGAR